MMMMPKSSLIMSVYEFTEYRFDNAVTGSVLSKVNATVNATAKLLTNSDVVLGSHDFDSASFNVSDRNIRIPSA